MSDGTSEAAPAVAPHFAIGKAHLYFKTHPVHPVHVSPYTVRNWVNIGILNQKTGQRVYLKAIHIGGQVLTSMQDYEQFIRDLNGESLQGGGE